MGISWSPDGGRVFLQDNWGSDVADCYVLTRGAPGIRRLRLSKLIQRTRGHPTAAEQRGHYYVHCDRWLSSDLIAGAVSGHTDTNPGHGFHHPFNYNARTHQMDWRRQLRSNVRFPPKADTRGPCDKISLEVQRRTHFAR